jgi:hypothetical protein
MTIYRADPPEIETIDLELTKKSGKNLGLGLFTTNPRGLLVTDIVSAVHTKRSLAPNETLSTFRFLEASLTLTAESKKVIL